MKFLKLTVWMAVFFLLQTVFADAIRICGYVPDMLMAFAMIYSFYEREKTYLLFTVIFCGVLAGSGVGREFSLVVLFTAIGCVSSSIASERLRFVPEFVRLFFVIIVDVFVLGCCEFFVVQNGIGSTFDVTKIIPHTIYTTAVAGIMCPIMVRTILYKPRKKFTVV